MGKIFSTNSAGKNCAPTCKRMKMDPSVTPYIKLNSKWIKDISVIFETIKILVASTGRNSFDISHSNFFLDTLSEARETTKINNWDYIKIKSFCTKEVSN